MGKNVLIITGSARKQGNSALLAEAFAKGARSAGHEVTVFDSAANPVKGCVACDTCWSKGKACSFDDGFDQLGPLLEKADTLVLCGPLYWFTFTAQQKAALDKFYSYMVPQCPNKLKLQESVLLMCGEDTDEAAFAGPLATYKSIVGYLKLTDKGTLLAPGVWAKGDIKKTEALAQAEKMGGGL